VHVEAPPGVEMIGEILEVEIAHANKHSLEGSATPAALAALPKGGAHSYPARAHRRALPVVSQAPAQGD